MELSRRDEITELARMTAHLDCAQQTFFQATYNRHRRNPTTALALCLFLGDFGAHEFYFGRHRQAILRLIFFWTLVPGIIALFEAAGIPTRARRANAAIARRILDALQAQASTERHPIASRPLASVPVGVLRAKPTIPLGNVLDPAGLEPPGMAPARRSVPVSAPISAALVHDEPDATRRERTPAHTARAEGVATAPITRDHAAHADSEDGHVAAFARSDPGVTVIYDHPGLVEGSTPLDEMMAPLDEQAPAASGAERAEDTAFTRSSRVPVLNYSMAAPARDAVRLGPPIEASAGDGPGDPDEIETAKVRAMPPQVPPQMSPQMPPDAPPERRTVQRIIVRKMAMHEGRILAEAVAERQIPLDGSRQEIAERAARATAEARREALEQLAAKVPPDAVDSVLRELRETSGTHAEVP